MGRRWINGYRYFEAVLLGSVGIGALLFLGARAAGRKTDNSDAKKQEAEALIQKALAAEDVRAAGSAAFRMRGIISVNGAKKQAAQGNYVLLWEAPDHWREEIQFHNYSRIRVGAKNAYWQTRSIDYELLPINDLSDALSFPHQLRALLRRLTEPEKSQAGLQPQLQLAKRKIKDRQADCILFKRAYQQSEAYCFDLQSAALLGEENMPWEGPDAEYSDFSTFKGRLFPGTIQVKRGDRAEVQFHLSEISPLGKTDGETFDAPPNARLWGSCADGERAKEVHAPAPRYPEEMKLEHISGTVYVYAVIGIDGMLHDMKVLPESEPRLVPSTIAAISTWNYAPASCGDTSFPVETIVTTTYTLGE